MSLSDCLFALPYAQGLNTFLKSVSSFGNDTFFTQIWGIHLFPNIQPGGPGVVIHLAFHPMAREGFLISKGKTIEPYGMGQMR